MIEKSGGSNDWSVGRVVYFDRTDGNYYPVPVPCKEEQKSIAGFLEKIEEREKKDKIMFESLQTIKTVLMQVLLTGEVRV